MPLNELALNGMANWLAGVAPYLALHSADPGPTGANETTAMRVAATWPAPVSGVLVISGKTFSGGTPLGTIGYVGLWSAPTGGVFYGSGLIAGDTTFNANGIFNLTNLGINGASA